MSNEFWLGLILAIPLAIIGNVITRPVQNYLDSRVRSRALRRARDTLQFIEEAERYREHPQYLYALLLYSLGWIAYWAVILVLGVSGFLVSILIDPQHFRVPEAPRLVGSVLCLLAVISSIRSIDKHAQRMVRMGNVLRWVPESESPENPTKDNED
jgi:hypothetical protein